MNDIAQSTLQQQSDPNLDPFIVNQFHDRTLRTTVKLDNVQQYFQKKLESLDSEIDWNEIAESYSTMKHTMMQQTQKMENQDSKKKLHIYLQNWQKQEQIHNSLKTYNEVNQNVAKQVVRSSPKTFLQKRYQTATNQPNLTNKTHPEKEIDKNQDSSTDSIDFNKEFDQVIEQFLQKEENQENDIVFESSQEEEENQLPKSITHCFLSDKSYYQIPLIIKQAVFFSNEAKLDKSYANILQVKQLIDSFKGTQDQHDYVNKIYREHQDFFDEIEFKYNYLQKNIKEIQSKGWVLDRDDKGIRVSYKFVKGCPTVSILMEAKIQVEAIKLMALINENDLYPKYVPFCQNPQIVKTINKNAKICRLEMHMPVIANREVIFVGEGIDRLEENGTIVLLSRSIDEDYEFQKKQGISIPPSEKAKYVRQVLNYYIFQIRPIDANNCEIKAVTNTDPKIKMVPQNLLAFVGRKFAFLLFEKIVKYARKFEQSPWKQKVEENKEFYDWLKNKIDVHLAQEDNLKK